MKGLLGSLLGQQPDDLTMAHNVLTPGKLKRPRVFEDREGVSPSGAESDGNSSVGAEPVSGPRRKRLVKLTRRRDHGDGDVDADGDGDKGGRSSKGVTAFAPSTRPTTRLHDVGGVDKYRQDILELFEYPLVRPDIFTSIGLDPPRGILLHGPSGCGKTLLAHAIAGELGVYFMAIAATEVVSSMAGESEKKLRDLFSDAAANAPSIVFIDEIDAIAAKREQSQRGMEKRIVTQLISCMDALTLEVTDGKAVIVIGATSRPDALDPGLRRTGRFDREICLGVPDDAGRAAILRVVTRKMNLPADFDYFAIARMTPGYVGADLAALAKEAAILCVNRVFGALIGDGTANCVDVAAPSRREAFGAAPESCAPCGSGKAVPDACASPGRVVPLVSGRNAVDGNESDGEPLVLDLGGALRGINRLGSMASMVDAGTNAAVSSCADVGTELSGEIVECAAAPTSGAMLPNAARATEEALSTIEQAFRARSLRLRHTSSTGVNHLSGTCVTFDDFVGATKKVQPSAIREGFATIPDVTWSDVGALKDVRSYLEVSIIKAIQNPEQYVDVWVKGAHHQ